MTIYAIATVTVIELTAIYGERLDNMSGLLFLLYSTYLGMFSSFIMSIVFHDIYILKLNILKITNNSIKSTEVSASQVSQVVRNRETDSSLTCIDL